jgi:hypothetical protein
MLPAAILQHGFARNPARGLGTRQQCIAVGSRRTGFRLSGLADAPKRPCRKKNRQAEACPTGTCRAVSVPRVLVLCYNRAAAITSRSVKCCSENACQAIFRVWQSAGCRVPLFRRANSRQPGCGRICKKPVRWARGSLRHWHRRADGCFEGRIAARPAHGGRAPCGGTRRGNTAGICAEVFRRERRIRSGLACLVPQFLTGQRRKVLCGRYKTTRILSS